MEQSKKISRKVISVLLSLLMVFSCFSGMGLTAYADNTETLLTTITATGKEQANYSTANVATVSFSYTAGGSSAYYANWGWWGYGWSATVNAAEGYTITKCVFYDDKDRTATDSSSPFVVETTEEDKTPQVNGTPILAYTSKGITKIEVYGYKTPPTEMLTKITPTGIDTYSESVPGVVTVTLSNISRYSSGWAYGGTVTVAPKEGYTITKCIFDARKGAVEDTEAPFSIDVGSATYVRSVEVYGYQAAGATTLTAETTTWENCDYVVPADGVTISGHITVKGTVNLTLTEGATLTANAGITLSDGATLNVSGEGAMTVNGTNNSTASTVAGNGTLVLTSGTLTAKGGNGQGIGDRQDNQTGANGGTAINGSVIVNGGTLTATGGNGGSVGNSCYNCKGGNGDAAISGNLTVNGGSMTATNGAAGSLGSRPINSSAGAAGASIGGTLTLGKDVTLYDGLGAVLDDNNSSSREYTGDRKQIMHAVYETIYAVTLITHTPAEAEGTVSMTYGDSSPLQPGETSLGDVKGKTVTLNINPKTGYQVKSVTVEKPAEATITLDNTTTAWRDGTYAVPAGGLTYSDAITVAGDVTLMLTDGETLTLNKGIALAEGATLTVRGGGTMNVNGTDSSTASTVAGTGTLVLTGGTLTAKGGDGQGFSDSGAQRNGAAGGVAINGNVTVEGGTLTATGGNGGSIAYSGTAGGDNHCGNGGAAISGSLTINGGTVTTTNGSNGTNSTYSWMGNSAGSGGKAVAGTVTDNTETGGAGNESNPEETATIIEAEKQTDGSWQFTMPDYSVTLNIKYEEGADKTALNNAITAAQTLYDSIKDDTDYSTIASTLKTAIDAAKEVADSETADQDAVDTANGAISDATTTAVVGMINALPASTEVTTSDKDKIEAVRAAYDNLTDAQKKSVDTDTLKKLTDAETALQDAIDTEAAQGATDTINALPAADEVTTADKDAIEAARKAYNDLTDDQKKKVDADTLKKLTDAEAALKDAFDTEAAQGATDTINALPDADEVTTANKDAIEAARKAYNDLTDDQKKKVSDDTLKKLTDAEDALAAAGASDKITALPEANAVKTSDKETIEKARAAYNALTDEQKEYVSADTLKKLTDAEDALAAAGASDKITALPEANAVKTSDKEAIEKARAAYNALTDEQKEYVSADTLKKLTDAEDALAAVEVSDEINALPAASDVTTADKDAIEKARAAYDALTDEQKAFVSDETLEKLTDAEETLFNKQIVDAVDKITNLPNASKVKTSDKDAIEAARAAYDALTDEQKEYVSAKTIKKLTDAENALAPALVNDMINALPAASDVTTADKEAIEAARKAYGTLTDEQKEKVSADTLKKLTDAEDALAAATVSDAINALPAADDVTANDKDAIEAARKAYASLTDEQKANVSADTIKKLTDDEAALKRIIEAEVAAVEDAINALPAANDVTTTDKTAIEAARAAYDALTDEQKEKVDSDALKKLTDAEDALAAAEVSEAINELPAADDVTTDDEEDIKAAKAAYDALTDEQKAYVSADTLEKLEAAEEALNALLKDGWVKEGDGWHFYKKGVMQTGWLEDDGQKYYLNEDGVMVTGFNEIDGETYFFAPSGRMCTGWVHSNGDWYYFSNVTGTMQTRSWIKTNGVWYYVSKDGVMQTNTWIKTNGSWYYVNASGAMLASTSQYINGKTYKFNATGVCTNP